MTTAVQQGTVRMQYPETQTGLLYILSTIYIQV